MRLKRRRSRHHVRQPKRQRNPNWRPADYKPSWNPKAICPQCLQPLGTEYMPVHPQGSKVDYHYECLIAKFKERKCA